MAKKVPVSKLRAHRFIAPSSRTKGVILKYNPVGSNTSEVWKDGEMLATGITGKKYVDSSSLSSQSEDADYTVYSIVDGTGDPEGSSVSTKALSTSSTSAAAAGAGSYQFFYGAVTSPGFNVDKGVRANISIANLGGGGATSKSAWIAIYGGNGLWVQWGYGWHKQFGNRQVFQMYRYGTQVFPNVTLLVQSVPYPTTGTSPLYSIYYTGSNNIWRASRDGVDYWEFDLETDSAGTYEVAIETGQASRPGKFPKVVFSNIQGKQVDTWTTPPTGMIFSASYGVNGNLQKSTIPEGTAEMGGSLKFVSSGTLIWS